MSQFININSQLDALRIKEFEEKFYEKISDNVKIVPKVTPFKGINTDLLYIKDNKILFVKFMDTSEELFSILDEELIEVMNEEYNMLRLKMAQQHSNINYNFVYIMPYVEIYDEYESQEFVNNNIIDKNKLKQIIEKEKDLDIYLKEENIWVPNIRPAIGYSSIPDHSIKKIIFEIINGEKTGASLTNNFAMTPLSTVCGIYISNPKSFYFNL